MHGHTYVLTVVVSGDPGANGFLIDFADIKAAVDPIVAELDHQLLNDVPWLNNPTVENQLEWLWNRLVPVLPLICQLRLREGMTSEGIYP